MTHGESDVRNLVYASCLALDREDYSSYLNLFTEDLNYRVVTYSPELKTEMTWLEHDNSEMKHLIKMLPQHVKMKGKFFRHVTVYDATQHADAWEALSYLTLSYTDLDGNTKLLAVGAYEDVIKTERNELKIDSRTVRLETRVLGPGIHVPL